MIHRLSFLIVNLLLLAEILSLELPINGGIVFQDHISQPPLDVLTLAKTNIEQQHDDKHKHLKHAQHASEISNKDSAKFDEIAAKKGKTTHVHKTTEDEAQSGKKHSNHDVDHYSKHHHDNHHKKHHDKYHHGQKEKKTNILKGYRQQYHKHEHKKHDSFYNNREKNGNYKKFGSSHHKKHSEFKKKSLENSNGNKGGNNSHSSRKTFKIEKPANILEKQHNNMQKISNKQHHQKLKNSTTV